MSVQHTVAVIGIGDAGMTLVNAWRNIRGIKLITVDVDPSRNPDFVGDLEAFLARHSTENLVLDICLPHDLHLNAALAAERVKVPYIMEKPLAKNLEEARSLVAVNRLRGLPAMVAENWVHVPCVRTLVDLCHDSDIGQPRLLEAHMQFRPGGSARPWYYDADASGGGVLLSGGVHLFSVARRILGDPVRLMWADFFASSSVENGAVAAFEFGHKCLGLFIIDRESPRSPGAYRLRLSTDKLTIDCDVKQDTLAIDNGRETVFQQRKQSMGISEQLMNFIQHLDGGQELLTPLSSELGTMAMTEAVYEHFRHSQEGVRRMA